MPARLRRAQATRLRRPGKAGFARRGLSRRVPKEAGRGVEAPLFVSSEKGAPALR